jgi:excisionase family DNA binding protein
MKRSTIPLPAAAAVDSPALKDLVTHLHDRPEVERPASLAVAVAPLLLTAPEAARLLAVSERTVWALTDRGELPCVRIGRAKRYDPRDLAEFVERLKVEGGGRR